MREEFNRAEALANTKRAGTVGFALTISGGGNVGSGMGGRVRRRPARVAATGGL